MMRKRLGFWVLITAALVCSFSPEASSKPSRKGKQRPPSSRQRAVASNPRLSFNGFVGTSDAAVLGVIRTISSPRWNSSSGKEWKRTLENDPLPFRFRDATLDVSEVLYGDAVVGPLALILGGSGDPADKGIVDGMISGDVAQGDLVVVVIKVGDFGMQGAKFAKRVFPQESSYGVWRVEGPRAINFDPARSTTVTILKNALIEERKVGLRLDRSTLSANQPFESANSTSVPTTKLLPPPPMIEPQRGTTKTINETILLPDLTVRWTADSFSYVVHVDEKGSKSTGVEIARSVFEGDPRSPLFCVRLRKASVVISMAREAASKTPPTMPGSAARRMTRLMVSDLVAPSA